MKPKKGNMRKTKLFLTNVAVFGAGAGLLLNVHAVGIKVDGTDLGAGVPDALARTNSPESIVAPGFSLDLLDQGIELLENPSGVISRYGFLSDAGQTKTEPDENT